MKIVRALPPLNIRGDKPDMTTFLIKVNAKRERVPGGIARPRKIADWQQMKFSVPRAKSKPSLYSNKDAGPPPTAQDEIFIWVNEANGGAGLTAHARLAAVNDADSTWEFDATDLRLLDRPIDMKAALTRTANALLFQRIAGFRHEKLWVLTRAEQDLIHTLVSRSGGFRADDQDDDAWRRALSSDRARIEVADRERRMALQKMRPGRQAFREAAMLRQGGRCVVTKCAVPEALEAAHVIPHTGEPLFERPENSLILRRDIHALFDAFLVSIDPETSEVVVAARLIGSAYAKLSGRRVDHQVTLSAVEHHFEEFKSTNDRS